MTWQQVLDLYMAAVGEAPAAYTERWLHLNDSYRKVCSKLDLQELEEDVDVLSTTASVDYVTRPSTAYHILSVHNQTQGCPVQPEPSGMRGRERYLAQTTGMPAEGVPTFYAITADKIYLRATPDGVYDLNVRFKIQPTALSDSDLASSPVTPSQWDTAIIAGAAASFMTLHPDSDQSYGDNNAPRSALLQAMADRTIQETPLPKAKELFDQRSRMFLPIWLRR